MKLYIDPGTGSMLFSLAVGLLSVLWFGAKKLYMKARYHVSGGTVDTRKKGIVIYGEDKRYWTTFKGILDEFEKRKVKVTYLAGSEDDPLLSEKYEYVETEVIGLGNKAYAKLNFLNARIVLATTPGLDVYQWKRSKDVDWYVHLTHSIGPGTGYRMFGTQFYDAVLLSADSYIAQQRELEHKRNSPPREIVAVGSTYMDYLLERKEIFQKKENNGNITVLVAPSWGKSAILSRFGEKILDALVATGYNIILRPHPQSFISESEMIQSLQLKYPDNDKFHWNRDSDNLQVLSSCDVMISDFSGVLFDYSFIFGRPVIYTNVDMDYSVYDSSWLDNPIYYTDVLKKMGIELKENDFSQLKNTIQMLINSDAFQENIYEARDNCWQNRGHASEKIVDYLIEKTKLLEH